MPKYLAPPSVTRVHRGTAVYVAVNGVIELPEDIGQDMGLAFAPAMRPAPAPAIEPIEKGTDVRREPLTREKAAAYLAARDGGETHLEAYRRIRPEGPIPPEPTLEEMQAARAHLAEETPAASVAVTVETVVPQQSGTLTSLEASGEESSPAAVEDKGKKGKARK